MIPTYFYIAVIILLFCAVLFFIIYSVSLLNSNKKTQVTASGFNNINRRKK